MPTIKLVEENMASPEVQALYDDIKRHFNIDFVPNIMKALAENPQVLKAEWEGYKELEQQWGKEMAYAMALAIDVANSCDYCINFDTAMLKQMGWDDAKINSLYQYVASNTWFNKYADALQIEPDVTPAMIEKRMAA